MIIQPNSNAHFKAVGLYNASANIGGNSAAFLPRLTLGRFSDEAQIVIEHADRPGPPGSFNGSVISQTLNGRTHAFRETPLGLRWEIDYNGRPIVDEEFTLGLSSGLSLHHQPELIAEQIAAGFLRPDEVVDSYAIYYDKQHHQVGGTNYESGKFGHIYAMYLVDRDVPSNKIKVPYTINNGKIITDYSSVQSWIDATPNIILDPDFGHTGFGASSANSSGGRVQIVGNLPAFPSGGGDIISMSTYANFANTSAAEIILAIYSDSSGPEDLLAQSSAFFDVTAVPDWMTNSITYTAVGSAVYWIGRIVESTSSRFYYDSVSGYDMNYESATWPTLTDPMTETLWAANFRISSYVTYTTAGAGAIINQLQGPNVGTDLYNGTLL